MQQIKQIKTGRNRKRPGTADLFNDLEDYKGSNPVVRDDGKLIAFQAAYAKAATGLGCGIDLFDVERWNFVFNKDARYFE